LDVSQKKNSNWKSSTEPELSSADTKTASLAIFILRCHKDDLVIQSMHRVLADWDGVDQKVSAPLQKYTSAFNHL